MGGRKAVRVIVCDAVAVAVAIVLVVVVVAVVSEDVVVRRRRGRC